MYPECKECTKLRATKWHKENYESALASKRRYAKTEKGRLARRREQKNRRRNGNYYRWMKDVDYKYDRSHKEHEISDIEWENCKVYFNNSCAYCGITEKEHKDRHGQVLHKEHVDHEGSNGVDNCVPSCRECNSSKYNFDLEYWYKERSLNYSDERYNKIKRWLENDHKEYLEVSI